MTNEIQKIIFTTISEAMKKFKFTSGECEWLTTKLKCSYEQGKIDQALDDSKFYDKNYK